MTRIEEKVLNYERELTPSDFQYSFVTYPRNRYGDYVRQTIIEPARAIAYQKYGIQVDELPWDDVPKCDGRVPYVLVNLGDILTIPAHEFEPYLESLVINSHARVNILTTFEYNMAGDSRNYTDQAAIAIPALDHRLGINTIFSDRTDSFYTGLRAPTIQDVVDNLICETIRLKVKAKQDISFEELQNLIQAQAMLEHISKPPQTN